MRKMILAAASATSVTSLTSFTGAALLFAGVITAAQTAPVTPRTADGNVDLNGIWGVAPLPPAVKAGESVRWLLPLKGVNPEGTDVFKGLDRWQVDARAAAPNKPEYKPEWVAKVKDLSDKQGVLDPAFYCKPQGVPRMGAPTQIVQTPGQVVFLYGASNLFRVIPTDGRPHRADADPSYMGDSIGRFEGDTLVVDVTNFNGKGWIATNAASGRMPAAMRVTATGATTFERMPCAAPSSATALDSAAMPALAAT